MTVVFVLCVAEGFDGNRAYQRRKKLKKYRDVDVFAG